MRLPAGNNGLQKPMVGRIDERNTSSNDTPRSLLSCAFFDSLQRNGFIAEA
jgi:hypothetical protein